jgi:AraC-like DNA-binding protein
MRSPSRNLGSPVVFARILQTALEAGMDGAALRELQRSEAWTERSRIWGRIMRSVRVDGFPVRVAQRYRLGDIGPLGMAVRVAPTLGDAFQRLVHLQHLLTGEAIAQIRDDAAHGTVVLEYHSSEGTDLGGRCLREMMVAAGVQFAREASGQRIRPRRVSFSHAAPRDSSEHEAFFDCEIRFEADYDGLEFDRDTLAIPLPAADPGLSYFLVEHLRAIARDPPPPRAATLEGRVRQAIHVRLGHETPTMDAVAQELGMSTRTLRRRLLEQQTSYHEILDQLRRELAEELLEDRDYKVSEVAVLLGFSDASAFHRAYLRWTGKTPAAQRRGSLGSGL